MLYAYTVVRKNAKKIETEETIGFFVTFLSSITFQLGGQTPKATPLATPMQVCNPTT